MTKYIALCLALIASVMPAHAGTTKKIVTQQTYNYDVEGWERPLVSRDPNLGRWYWGAMECTGRRRSTSIITTGDKAKPGQRICYVKPIHLPLPTSPRHALTENHEPNKPALPESTKSYSAYSKQASHTAKSTSKLSGSLLNVGVKAEIKKLNNG